MYDGQGNRLQAVAHANGSTITATYTLDPRSGLPLLVDNGINVTMILYGQVAIGEYAVQTAEWRYYLGDAQLSVRQLVDVAGTVTKVQTYGPYGVLLYQAGDGGGLFGYKGGQSAANGLWYFGDGYFDPQTGQFLATNGNPLLPLAAAAMANPGGLLFGPVLFIHWRRRKGKKGVHPATFLLLGVLLAVGLSGCDPALPTPIPGFPTIPPKSTSVPEPTVTITKVQTATSTATVVTIAATPTATECPPDTPTPTPTPDPQPILASWDTLVLFTDPIATPTPPPTGDAAKNINWKESEKDVVRAAASRIANKLAATIKREHPTWDVDQFPNKAFIMVYGGPVTFAKTGESCQRATGNNGCWAETQTRTLIEVYADSDIRHSASESSYHWAVHELGHAFVKAVGNDPVDTLDNAIKKKDDEGNLKYPHLGRPPTGQSWGFAGPFSKWQNSEVDSPAEVFADMYTGWVYNSWEADETASDGLSDDGRVRRNFMENHMSTWIEAAIRNENWTK